MRRFEVPFWAVIVYTLAFSVASGWALFSSGGLVDKLGWLSLLTFPGSLFLSGVSFGGTENISFIIALVGGFGLNAIAIYLVILSIQKLLRHFREQQ